jgi:hypothetical protein
MTLPIAEYVAQAGQVDFDVPFPFLSKSDVEVRANGIRYYPSGWVNDTRLRLQSPPGAGAFVTITRNTPIDAQSVVFQNGAVLTKEDLNTAVQQVFFKQQELTALYEGTLLAARVRIGEAGGVAITPEDAANQIASMIAADQILDDFRARIAELDVSAETIISQAVGNVARFEKNAAAIVEERKTRATALEVEATARLDLAVVLGDLEGVVQQHATARINQDGVFLELFDLLGAKSPDGRAFILRDDVIKLSDGRALATRLAGIDVALGNVTGAILTQEQVEAIAGQVTASAVNVVNTSVGNLSTSVSTISQSVNGIAGRWGVQLDANGYISGIVMNNDSVRSDMTVGVDVFRIINRVSGYAMYPFRVEDGAVYINEAYIKDLHADKITAGTIIADRLAWGTLTPGQFASGAVGEASAVYDNSTLTINTSNWIDITRIAITPAQGAPIQGLFTATLTDVSHDNGQGYVRVIRDDGVAVWGGASGSYMGWRDGGSVMTVTFFDVVPQYRSTAYTLQIMRTGDNDVTQVRSRVGWLQELSRLHFQQFDIIAGGGTSGEGPGGGFGGNPIP